MEPFLQKNQCRAYAILSAHGAARFFLRRSLGNHCLWVSDLPRYGAEDLWKAAATELHSQGFLCVLQPEARLLEIDLALEAYEKLLAPLPQNPPELPAHSAYHPAYALCRLLLLHPAPLKSQPMEPLRDILKAEAQGNPAVLSSRVPALHEQCAQWLRTGQPLPYAAGQVLAAWLPRQRGSRSNGDGAP